MNIQVINTGNCMMCGREIKIVIRRGNSKSPNIFLCPRCERLLKKDNSQESEEI